MGGYGWIVWAALIVLFIIVETVTVELTFMTLALGALAGLLADVFGAPWWLSVAIAAVVALLGIFLLRPPLLRRLRRGGDPTKSNIDAIIGSAGSSLNSISAAGGQVKLANGETWSARLAPGSTETLGEGLPVRVVSVEGATVVVIPTA